MRLTGKLSSVADLKQLPILVGDKTIRLSDVAEVYRGFSEPAQPRMRFMGDNGIGIAVSMRKGGDIIALGKQLQQTFLICKNFTFGHDFKQGLRSASRGSAQYSRVYSGTGRSGHYCAVGQFLLFRIPNRTGGGVFHSTGLGHDLCRHASV